MAIATFFWYFKNILVLLPTQQNTVIACYKGKLTCTSSNHYVKRISLPADKKTIYKIFDLS